MNLLKNNLFFLIYIFCSVANFSGYSQFVAAPPCQNFPLSWGTPGEASPPLSFSKI